MKTIIFYIIWFSIILIGPLAVFINTPLSSALASQVLLLNFFQRILGLLAFGLILSQIMLGFFMTALSQKLGSWIYKFHVTEGIIAYLVFVSHPLAFVLINYKLKGAFDPFYVYTDICLVCKGLIEYYYTFGRVAFWFLTIGVAAAYFRTHPWLRVHWLKFHILNYFAFYLIALHAWFSGTDVRSKPFAWFYWLAVVSVSATVIYKISRPIFFKINLQK